MLSTTVAQLCCPRCSGELSLEAREKEALREGVTEVRSGELKCKKCRTGFPILAGVALLVPDVHSYILEHVKGIAPSVPVAALPKGVQRDFVRAKGELAEEHIEEDLESERVTSLYLMNHYLRVDGSAREWWKADHGASSPLIDHLVRENWDHGPFATIAEWLKPRAQARSGTPGGGLSVVELGCGVGGLWGDLQRSTGRYLGIDSSFASIALARHYALGARYASKPPKIPRDLLHGPVSADPAIRPAENPDGRADFVVGELEHLPTAKGGFDVSIALNAIDMLDDPGLLPKLQKTLVREGGLAVQSCPYVWHARAARKLRRQIPKDVQDSAAAVEWLYGKEGFKITERVLHLPWLFFKHARQLEIYSVHLFLALKA
jgi:SAM-dependent methyltransferase